MQQDTILKFSQNILKNVINCSVTFSLLRITNAYKSWQYTATYKTVVLLYLIYVFSC